jgi:uncharacterized protein (TIGR03437 family)
MALNRSVSKVCAILGLLPITLLAQADRISGPVDPSRLLPVLGSVNPRATPAADQGPVDPAMKLNYVRLMLKPTEAQQAQLDQLLREQQTPGSPNFRKWLTPEQFAVRFGVSQADIGKITDWMRSQGFDVITVGRGRKFIAFNATAQQIQSALKTEIHRYRVNGELHFANTTDPSVPAAIQPLVLGFMGLDDFKPKPAHSGTAAKPRYTDSNGNNELAPGDLAIIYNLLPVYSKQVTGSGESIAVIGQSNVQLSDINTFRSTFALSVNPPTRVLVPGSTDPGTTSSDDEQESDLDLEWAGGIAYDATVLFVYSTDVGTSVTYAIDQDLAPVITMSYGACELDASSADAGAYQSLAQQANAEGITWLNSSGDDGAAACDTQRAQYGLAVQVPTAVPEVTGVGGLMFNEDAGNYWLAQNNANGSSATKYIPETVWDESTATQLSAGGGGFSTFFTQPAWQAGPGVRAGAMRGVPDVSLAAANDHDPYIIVTGGNFQLVGGTSAATPSFAAMILLLNQWLGTNGLGNINPTLYGMAQSTPSVFHDITTGNNDVPCVAGSPDCGASGHFGYSAGLGWDPASGLGSVDAYQLFTNWNTGAVSTTTTVTANPSSFTLSGSTQLTATVTASGNVTPTGTVAFTVGSLSLGSATLSGSGSSATASLTAYGSQFSGGNNAVEASYSGSNSISGSTGSVSVTVSVPQAASAVVPSVTPDPVYEQKPNADGYSWFFTVTLTDQTSTGTTLTGFTINGADETSNIDNFFGSSAIPGNGTLSAVLEGNHEAIPSVPYQVVFGFTGQDAGGAQWTQQITVPFYGMQITAAMELVGLPNTVLGDPTQPADCEWFQFLGLQELNGHTVYLQHFYADGEDLSSQISDYFGASILPPLGDLLGGVCWDFNGYPLPETLSYEIDGVDDAGNKISTTASGTFQQPAANPGTLGTSADANYDYVALAVAASQSATASINVDVNSGQAWTVSLFPSNRTTQWLTAYPFSGTGPATVNLSASGSGLAPGLYPAFLVFQSVDALPESITVEVDFVVGSPHIGAVVNGASFTNTGLSPGQFFSVFGSGLGPANGQSLELDQNGNLASNLDGLTVLVNGTPAPLLYLSPTQINAIAPYEIADNVGQTAAVQINDNGVTSSSFNVKVVAAAPAIFPLGNGQGAILNQDYSVNGPKNPAAPGSFIYIFGTGQGQTKPPGVDGQINGSSPASLPVPVGAFSLTIGGVPADVAFAGDAPYSVDGFFQVDAKIPASVKSGNQPVILKIGGVSGPPANVAVK